MNNWNEIVELDTNEDEDEQFMQEAYCVTALVGQYAIHHLCKEPSRDSEQTGHARVREILHGHPKRCYEMFRMEKHVFYKLCTELVGHGLKGTTHMGVEEMIGLFLNTVGHGVGTRFAQEFFQHSGETVSRQFHNVLTACFKLSIAYIRPQDPMFRDSQSKLQDYQRYWPFFKNAIGAIDGTHVPCVVSPSEQPKFIGRKGYPTQNVMVVCDWNMCFTFVLPGWEGTAHDARVFNQVVTNPNMNFPHPPNCERYHLPDFRRQSGFSNHKEVFNYYHSSLRCTIERTFGVWKNRFAILRKMPKFKIETQVQLVCVTMSIHNFIRRHAEMNIDFNQYEDDESIIGDTNDHGDVNLESSSVLDTSSSLEMDHVRDSIRDQIVMFKNIN